MGEIEILDKEYLNYQTLQETALFKLLESLDPGVANRVVEIASMAAHELSMVVQHMPVR